MSTGLIATAEITIHAPLATVWNALLDPVLIKQYMFGTDVVTDWTVGSSITWKGIWKEKPYEDTGTILRIEPQKILQYSHYSPLSGKADTPENYHTLTYVLSEENDGTHVSLSQDNNANEESQKHSQEMWEAMLQSMKKVIEEK